MPDSILLLSRALHRAGSLLWAGVVAAAALAAPAEAQGYATITNHWYPDEVLRVAGGNPGINPAGPDLTATQWLFEPVDPEGFKLRNRRAGRYLSASGSGVALTAATAATVWLPVRNGDHFRLQAVGGDAVLDRPSDDTLVLATTPTGNWSSNWSFSFDEVPAFATAELDPITDWTTVDISDPAHYRRLIFATLALISAPDTPASLALKRRWTAIFPYLPEDGDNNRGENILLPDGALDQPSPAYNAQTSTVYATGFYAAPGEEIAVLVPDDFIDRGAFLKIGHLDEPRLGLDSDGKPLRFSRFPQSLATSRPIDRAHATQVGNQWRVSLSNGFGGVIYIGGGAGFDPGGAWINVAGGQRMPVYHLGVTGAAAWSDIRHYAAPWAEIRSDRVAITLPSSLIRWVADPGPIALYWDAVTRAQDEFVGIAQDRRAPDRLDIDIAMDDGVGAWATDHTVTAPLPWAEDYLESRDTRDWWGWYHEIGHNHQAPAWGWVGSTSEVTNNIAVLYARDVLHGTKGYGNILAAWDPNQPMAVFRDVQGHLASPAATRAETWADPLPSTDYAVTKPMVKLTMFAFLQEHFGWEAFQSAFAAYHAPGFAMPDTALAQFDTLLVELSRASGHDLSDYAALWGIPVTPALTQRLRAVRVGSGGTATLEGFRPETGTDIGFSINAITVAVGPEDSDAPSHRLRDFRFTLPGSTGANVLWRAAGGPVEVSLQFDPTCLDCTLPNNLIAGIRGASSTGAVVWHGAQTQPVWSPIANSFWNNWTGTLDVPNTPGTYEVCVAQTEGTSAEDALKRVQTAAIPVCTTLGLVIVGT